MKAQEKAANEVQFAQATAPELVQLSRLEDRRMLVTAEKRLAAGDPKGAQELAQQALEKKIGDRRAGAVHPGASCCSEQESRGRGGRISRRRSRRRKIPRSSRGRMCIWEGFWI